MGDKECVNERKASKLQAFAALDECDAFLEQLLNERMSQMDDEETEPPLKRQKVANNEEMEPASFSRIDLTRVDYKKYPKYKKVHRLKQLVTVSEGQMLYLPCGWFHDNTSVSNAESKSHLAINYWMHPPIKEGDFKRPYADQYWKEYNADNFNL